MTIIVETRPITGGVDTHLDTHVAAALDANGGVLGVESFATTTAGFAELHAWLSSFGNLDRVGVEGTGAYGAGLARFLRSTGAMVIEVGRPSRQARRAPRQVRQHRRRRGCPSGAVGPGARSGEDRRWQRRGDPGAARWLTARAVTHASKCLNQLRHLGFCAPDDLRERFRGVTVAGLAETAAGAAPQPCRRSRRARHEAGDADPRSTCPRHRRRLRPPPSTSSPHLVKATAPTLLDLHGVGVLTAALLLVAAGDNTPADHL